MPQPIDLTHLHWHSSSYLVFPARAVLHPSASSSSTSSATGFMKQSVPPEPELKKSALYVPKSRQPPRTLERVLHFSKKNQTRLELTVL